MPAGGGAGSSVALQVERAAQQLKQVRCVLGQGGLAQQALAPDRDTEADAGWHARRVRLRDEAVVGGGDYPGLVPVGGTAAAGGMALVRVA